MRHLKTLLLLAIVTLVALFWFWHKRSADVPAVSGARNASLQTSHVADSKSPSSSPKPDIERSLLKGQPAFSASLAEKGAWAREMNKRDPYWQYKMPISFYGRVQDEQGQPVADASVRFSWKDMSSEGTSQQTTSSDQDGRFNLFGATGKSLSVFVSKEGYKHYYSRNRFSFEFSVLANPDKYYAPDRLNPIVFVLRKDRQGEPLIIRSREQAQLRSAGDTKSFPVGSGDAFVSVERLPGASSDARSWEARVTVSSGGLCLTSEEFPFEAPEAGYTNEFVITRETPHPPLGDLGGTFYIKTQAGYGRVVVYYVLNSPWVYVESWFNPNPESRNLEADPNKIIKVQ